jgi:hypothetical protein
MSIRNWLPSLMFNKVLYNHSKIAIIWPHLARCAQLV